MAKEKPIPEPEIIAPEHITKSKVMTKKRVTKRGLSTLSLEMMAAWGPEMVGVWFTEKYKAAKRGDKDALDDIAEVYGLIAKRGGGGPQLNLNVGGQMAVAGGNGIGVGFDGFIRQLHEVRQGAVRQADNRLALPEPKEAA